MIDKMDALIIVLLLAALVLLLIAVRIRRERRAVAWGRSMDQRLEIIEHKLALVREDVEHRDLKTNARVNVLERRMAAYEAPEPMETLLDEEGED